MTKYPAFQSDTTGPVYLLLGVFTGQRQHTLKQPVGAYSPFLNRSSSPTQSPRPDSFGFDQQPILVYLLAGRLLREVGFVPGIESAGHRSAVDTHTFALVINPYQAVIPIDSHLFPQQAVWHCIESPADFNIAVQMDQPCT